jgi:hypothetical protein
MDFEWRGAMKPSRRTVVLLAAGAALAVELRRQLCCHGVKMWRQNQELFQIQFTSKSL